MWRSLLALSCIAVLWTQPPTVSVTFAWDLHPTHAGATWEVEANAAVYPCLSVTVTPKDRRCTATLPRSSTAFRVRGTNTDGVVGAWSSFVTASLLGPGPFTIRTHSIADMAIAFLDSIGAQSTTGNGVTTGSANTTGATLIVVAVASHEPSAEPTLSDLVGGNSNTWVPITVVNGVGPRMHVYYAASPIVGSGHTFTVTGTSSFPSVAAIWFSGSHASVPFDQQNGAEVSGVTSGQPGSITPSEDGEVIVAAMGTASAGSYSIDSPFTAEENLTIVGGQAYGLLLAYSIQTTATARNPTFSFSSGASALKQASFKVGAAAAPVERLLRPNNLRPAIFSPGRAR